jgi:hypothetical protein
MKKNLKDVLENDSALGDFRGWAERLYRIVCPNPDETDEKIIKDLLQPERLRAIAKDLLEKNK